MNPPDPTFLDQPVLALGLMSGTSLDGIDAALIATDGERIDRIGGATTLAYGPEMRDRLRAILGRTEPDEETDAVERDLTLAHGAAVTALLEREGVAAADVRVVGFHGHTVSHQPSAGATWQIGDGALLAAETGIDVVADFRSADMAAGGEGAPLAPAYHAAMASNFDRPLAVLNIGGVANVTWIGAGDALLAFDTGPGNALLDDWVRARTGAAFDANGALAGAGRVDEAALAALLDDPWFERVPPKSLDRGDFDPAPVEALSAQDGAATLTAFTAAAVAEAGEHFPAPAIRWLVTGGGRHNPSIMAALAARLAEPVEPVEQAGWDGDAIEAQAFAFLAVRSIRDMPISYPTTTGVKKPATGGRLFKTSD